MTSHNLVTIDFDSDVVSESHEAETTSKKKCLQKVLEESEVSEVIFRDCNNLEDIDSHIPSESQPLLGSGSDHHETHQVIYNQFPSKSN